MNWIFIFSLSLAFLGVLIPASFSSSSSSSPHSLLDSYPYNASHCIPSSAQETYTNITDYLTWNDPFNHSPQYDLTLSNGHFAGSFPDPIRFDGVGSSPLPLSSGMVNVNSQTKEGKYYLQFYADNLSPQEGVVLNGMIEVLSTDFQSTPANSYSPYMQYGIAQNVIQHGCTQQGEPSFPLLRSRISTWGHCDIYINGTLLYKDLWLHTMLTNNYRDNTTYAMYANSSKTSFYSPKRCWEGLVSDDVSVDGMILDVIIARWCWNRNQKVHPQTDVTFVMSFEVEENEEMDGNEQENQDEGKERRKEMNMRMEELRKRKEIEEMEMEDSGNLRR